MSFLTAVYLLYFADDMKIFSCISSIDDYNLLQCDLDSFVGLLSLFSFFLFSCSYMTFTRRRTPIIGSYYIIDTPILSCGNSGLDLGLYLVRFLSPSMHVKNICYKALKILGFVKRICSQI